jgi:hypothetical protein
MPQDKSLLRQFVGTAKDLIRQFLKLLMEKGGNKNSQITMLPFPCDFSTVLNKNIFYSRIPITGIFYKQLTIVDCGY